MCLEDQEGGKQPFDHLCCLNEAKEFPGGGGRGYSQAGSISVLHISSFDLLSPTAKDPISSSQSQVEFHSLRKALYTELLPSKE